MIFKRKVYAKLIEWKALAAGTSAVLLEGARRIGKSTIVEEFAKKEYDDYMILDFARENQDVKNNFVENMNDLDCIFRKNRALAPHERSAVPLGTDHCPVG